MKKIERQPLLYGILGCIILLAILLWPQQSTEGMVAGILSCGKQVIPALFPFFVVSHLIIASPLADWLGIVLHPFTRFGLGIPNRKAATALLISWLGGFAVAAKTISDLYKQAQITRRQATLLLVCGVGSGPAFVINTVGLLMLGSSPVGVCMMLALLCANMATAMIFRGIVALFCASGAEDVSPSLPLTQDTFSKPVDLVSAVTSSVDSMLTVCGFVMFFRFVCTVLASALPPSEYIFFFVCAGLEVTTGCTVASMLSGDLAIAACCFALSVQSLSVFLQVRALLCRDLSLVPLILVRPIHFLFTLLFLPRFLRHIPGYAPAISTLCNKVIPTTRTAPDAAIVLFILCCVVLHMLSQIQWKKSFSKQ